MPKTFKGSAPVVRDLSGESERERESFLRRDFKWGNGKNREIMS